MPAGAIVVIAALCVSPVAAQAPTPTRTPDVIFVPTPEEVVEAMLQSPHFLYRAELSLLRTHHQPLPEPLPSGLGEAVVQGAVNPDEFYVYKPSLRAGRPAILKRSIGGKATKMIYTEDREVGKTTAFVDVDEADRRRLSRRGGRCHRHRIGQIALLHAAGSVGGDHPPGQGVIPVSYQGAGTGSGRG